MTIKIICSLVFVFTLLTPFTANAQEINPAPGTYVYGSGSELSQYMQLGQAGSSGTLAPTGDSKIVGYIIIGSLIIAAGGLLLIALRRKGGTA